MLNSRRTGLLAAACALALLPGFAAAETLADAVALAYQSNPTLQQQRARLRALDESYVQARQGYRPQADVQASGTYTNNNAPQTLFGGGGESNSGSAVLSASQPLYTGGRVTNAVRAAEADILSGREQLRQVEASVLLSVIQAYVDVRRDVQFLGIRTENLNVLTRQLEEARARFEVGEITRTDVAQSEARLAASRAQLASTRAQLAISRSVYAAVVGQNPGDLGPEPPLLGLPATVDDAFSVAEDISPVIRTAAYAEQASRLRVAAARADLRPTIALQGRIGYDGPLDPLNREDFTRTVSASAVITQPLYAGGFRRSRIRQQTEQNTADLIAVEGSRRDVLQDVSQAWNQLDAARSNILSNEEQVRANRIAAEGVREEAAVGLRTTIEVLNAEQELRNAELLLVQARRDNYLAGASLLGAMGRLEAANLLPGLPTYEPDAAFRRIRGAGSVPWEGVVETLDALGVPRPASRAVVVEDAPVETR